MKFGRFLCGFMAWSPNPNRKKIHAGTITGENERKTVDNFEFESENMQMVIHEQEEQAAHQTFDPTVGFNMIVDEEGNNGSKTEQEKGEDPENDTEDEEKFRLLKRTKRLARDHFLLRDVNLNDFDHLATEADILTIKNHIFSFDLKNGYGLDWKVMNNIYNVVTKDPVFGEQPNLPFTLESFFEYLFLQCRDLVLIRLLLRFCTMVPNILNDYDNLLKSWRYNGYGIRELFMLPFLVEMAYAFDEVAVKLVFQLMGFRGFQDLKFYYDENFMNDPLIGELISSLRRFFEDESSDESDIFDRSDDDCYFSY